MAPGNLLNDYLKKDFRLSYLLTKDHSEIDLILERPGTPTTLIEIKSSAQIGTRDVSTLERLLGDFKNAKAFYLSLDPHPKKIGAIELLPWQNGIQEIFKG